MKTFFVATLLSLAMLAMPAQAETAVQQSWRCQAGDVQVISNTPCRDGAQPVMRGTAVIYQCLQNGVLSFQQRPCAAADKRVQLYTDTRTPQDIKSGQQVRSSVLSQANAARAEQLARERSRGVTVIGKVESTNRTAGDGKSDGYRKPNRSSGGY